MTPARVVIHLNSPRMRGLVRGRRIVLGIAFKNPKSDFACIPKVSGCCQRQEENAAYRALGISSTMKLEYGKQCTSVKNKVL